MMFNLNLIQRKHLLTKVYVFVGIGERMEGIWICVNSVWEMRGLFIGKEVFSKKLNSKSLDWNNLKTFYEKSEVNGIFHSQ